jgi:hypothetical protein
MASKVVLINAFYEQFSSLLIELSEMYPNDEDFPMYITGLKWFKSMNPSKTIRDVYENTKLFEDKILAKDDKFFLEYKFDEYGEYIDNNIFVKLKQYIMGMSPESKKSVWQYIVNISRLAKACSQ